MTSNGMAFKLNLHSSFAEPPEPPLCLEQSHRRGLAADSLQKTANTAKKVQIAHRRKAGDEPAMSRPNSRIGTLWVKPPTERAERDPTESGSEARLSMPRRVRRAVTPPPGRSQSLLSFWERSSRSRHRQASSVLCSDGSVPEPGPERAPEPLFSAPSLLYDPVAHLNTFSSLKDHRRIIES